MNTINWSLLPEVLRKNYSSLTKHNMENLHAHFFEEKNGMMPIMPRENHSNSFNIFAKEYNSILLTAHLFENLLMLEDIRHEENGHDWFQIEIPVEYFRYPALNNPKDMFSQRGMTIEEKNIIESAIKTTKNEMRYSKDENIVKENLHKLEFLSLFSYFEAYLENILVEKLNYDKRTASNKTKYNSLDKLLKIVISEINLELENLLLAMKEGFFRFIKFSYLVRNLHTHNLGRANEDFMNKCFNEELIIREVGTTKTGEIVHTGVIRTNFGYPDKIIEDGRYITLSVISYEFRNYVRECIFMIESCLIFKEELSYGE